MSIQQNINQMLSLASFVASQTPMAAARREEAAMRQREKHEDIATTKSYEQAKTLYQGVSKAIEEGEETKLVEESVQDPTDLERRTERFVRAAEDYEARFGTRPPLEGKPDADIVGGEGYNAEAYLKRIKAEPSRREAAAKKAEADREAAAELERQRQLGPKGISREAVESRLWNREDKK